MMTTDERRLFNERAERLDAYRATIADAHVRIAELEAALYTVEQKYTGACSKIGELEIALAEETVSAEYWDAENARLLELCRTKLGKRDVHGVADGIEQLAARGSK